jgi:diguanylate cyclase (GGDEF)-like protein/PAS domain S-box-containing protein
MNNKLPNKRKKDTVNIFSKDELRQSAESLIDKSELEELKDWNRYSKEDIIEVVHDLRVHQMELQLQNDELIRVHNELLSTKARYFDLFNNAPVGYLTVKKNGLISEANFHAGKELQLEHLSLANKKVTDYIYYEDQDLYYLHFRQLFQKQERQITELRFIDSKGQPFWVHLQSSLIDDEGEEKCRMVLNNINTQKEIENMLRDSEEKYRLICTTMDQALSLNEIILNEDGNPVDFRILDVNQSFIEMHELQDIHCVGKYGSELGNVFNTKHLNIYSEVALLGKTVNLQEFDAERDKFYSISIYSPKVSQFIVMTADVTERVRKENEINYMKYHDSLTSLPNRRFFEEEVIRLRDEESDPLSVVVADINGLKLVNDSFGHVIGDKLLCMFSKVLDMESNGRNTVARIGGDEFVILLPQTSSDEVLAIVSRIKQRMSTIIINSIELSVSFGYSSTMSVAEKSIQDVFKCAEDMMYANKLLENASAKSSMIDLIMTTLFEKNEREMRHSKRVGDLCEVIAFEMGFTEDEINQVKIAGMMHDIGKIGVHESILNSHKKLTEEEFEQVKRHSEIGYRILSSSKEFSEIAGYVLQHHERWDGKGYPNALKATEISLFSRIITLADSYDAMTRQRTYRAVMSKDEAIIEIEKNKSKQFDPNIVDVFFDKVIDKL